MEGDLYSLEQEKKKKKANVSCAVPRLKLYDNQKNSPKFSWPDSKLSLFYQIMHQPVMFTFF